MLESIQFKREKHISQEKFPYKINTKITLKYIWKAIADAVEKNSWFKYYQNFIAPKTS